MRRILLAGLLLAGASLGDESSCPVQVEQIHPKWVLNCADPWKSCLLLVYRNTSPKKIIGIRFGVSFTDSLGDFNESVYDYDAQASLKPGKNPAKE